MYNAKIKCIKCVENSFISDFTKGCIYTVVDGKFRDDKGFIWYNDDVGFKSLQDINNYFSQEDEFNAEFDEVK